MRIGITGGRGFIGSCLVHHLLKTDLGSIRILVRNLAGAGDCEEIEVVGGDLRSHADCERFAADLDVVFYLAHCNSPINSDEDQPSDALLNLMPLLTFLDAVRKRSRPLHIVYFSSGGAVYGRREERVPFRETDPCQPQCSYGIQKLAAEHYLRVAAERGAITCTVLRVGNAYGTLLPRYRMQGLIGVAVNNILHNESVRIFGDVHNVRDYVHIQDICALCERVCRPREPFALVNVGSGLGHSVEDVLSLIAESAGTTLNVQPGPPVGRWLTDWVVLNIDRAGEQFGWRPCIDLRGGIAGLVANCRLAPHAAEAIA